MASERPNIVLITTDQQRFDTWGRFAPPFMRTPHLDRLAVEGVTFTRAYADCPICVPARAAYMTGQSVFRHGMGTNAPSCEYFGRENTLPDILRRAGYQTCAIGKMHFHPQRARHGFDETITLDDYYRWIAAQGGPIQPRRHGLGENELYATMATVPEPMTLTSWITEKAYEFLQFRREPDQPFFLWISYSKPHPPLDPPEPYYSMYRDSDIPQPWMADWADDPDRPDAVKRHQQASGVDRMSPELIRQARSAYYGLITHIDYNIGRIMAGLQDTGCFFSPNDNTMMLFCSDHGELLGDHRMAAKDTLHEGSAHVPFILRLPRAWKDKPIGIERDDVVSHQDILPTFAAAAGAETPPDCDGRNLLVPVLSGEPVDDDPYLLCGAGFNHHSERIGWAGVTDGRWKYAWHYVDGKEELFDVASDPHELRNLAGDASCRDRFHELRAETIRRLADHGGRFLRDGDLYVHEGQPPTEARRRYGGFPGHMADGHRSDALH